MSSARVGWLVQELEEENASLQEELKGVTDERDLLRREVDRQRRLLKNCVEEVFALKDELSHLLSTHCPPAESQRQQRLCERLAKHVTDIEREVAEKGARAEAWRAEREQRETAMKELESSLDRQTQESRRLNKELEQALLKSEKQSHEHLHKIAELEETVDSITKAKAESEARYAREVDQMKKSIDGAEQSVKSASVSQQQLAQARREYERQLRQLAELRQTVAQRDVTLAESGRQLTERASQLAEARRQLEVKAAQVIGLKSAVQDAKNRNTQLEKELAKKTKEEETQAKTILRKEGVIQRQKTKLEEVANDLNKLKALFANLDIPGLCECNEGEMVGSLKDIRAVCGARLPPPCPAKQLRLATEDLKKQLASSRARTRQLESSLDEIRQKLPQMSAEADRAYIELQTRLKDSQASHQAAQSAQQEQQKRSQQLMLKLAGVARKLRDSEQLVIRLRQENRSLVTDRTEWERTSAKLQAALHETVQLTARAQAARAKLEAERKLTAQLRRRLDQADAQMKSQLNSVVEELQQLKQASGPVVDWPRKYEALLDKCQQWQEECLSRQKDCQLMEQRLGEIASQQPERAGEGGTSPEEEQLCRLELQLRALLEAFSRSGAPPSLARARSVPEMPLPAAGSGTVSWEPADTSSGSLRTDERPTRDKSPAPKPGSQSSMLHSGRRSQSSLVSDQRTSASAQGRPASALSQKTAPPATGRTVASVPIPDLGPLMSRVAEVVQEMERQRSQLAAQEHLLEAYRKRDPTWPQQLELAVPEEQSEQPCRDSGGGGGAGGRDGGDGSPPAAPGSAHDAQASPPPPATEGEGVARRRRPLSGRRDQEQLERLAHYHALHQLLNKMAPPPTGPGPEPAGTSPEAVVPDVTELRAQWRRLETMVRDEAESARTRSDVILRMSGMSESSATQ